MDLKIADYWDRRAESYADMRRGHLNGSNFKAWKKELKEKFPDSANLKILDVGTATGFLGIVAASLGHQVTAIDISEHILEVAAREAKAFLKKDASLVSFVRMDAQALAFPDDSFDVVMTRNATYSFTDVSTAYRECYRVLKPGGVFLNYDADAGQVTYTSYAPKDDPEVSAFYRESDEIRKRLSISYVKRPEWDVAVLRDCGFAHCESDLNISRKFSPHGTKSGSGMFLLYAVKPLPSDSMRFGPENQVLLDHMLLKKREERFYSRFFQRQQISDLHYVVLQLLYLHQEGLRPCDICDHQLIPRQTMTHIIHALTRQEYICQVKNPKDGRSVLLVLTEKGKQYFEDVSEKMLLLEQETLREVGQETFVKYNRFYNKYLDKLYEIGMKYDM